MGYLEVLSVITAQLCAAGGIILRLGVLGLVIERVQSTKVSWRPLAAGVGVAAVAAIVTVVKVVLTH
jgi:F420-0:gamma-glutamyl ligase-like protein